MRMLPPASRCGNGHAGIKLLKTTRPISLMAEDYQTLTGPLSRRSPLFSPCPTQPALTQRD